MERQGIWLKHSVHRFTYYTIFFFFITSTSSCLSNSKKKIALPKGESRAEWWQRMLNRAEKDHEIYGAFDVSKDTIILLRRSVGIELSADNSKTWKWLGKKIFRIDEFTIDDKGIWWGLERWMGIHEPSYCRMHSSNDAGQTWTTYEFNTSIFFPFHINSKPRQPLEVIDGWSKKVHRLVGGDASQNWRFIKQLPDNDNDITDLSVGNYFISNDNDHNKLYVKRQNGKTDTLMSFTKAYNIYEMELSKNTIYVAGPDTSGKNSYFAVIKNEKLLHEFTIPGGDINLIKTQFNHIYLTSTDGAYQYKNNSVVNIYK
ncbi:hypothetical protein [Mucilaginibacter sp. OK283]|uniref:hypothetical protein n=1 Tax=Mucilaginibacter sp. OK283 TaxID=1881049 RepID=UPI0008B56C3B|nr:hypothetical protein [Mucilaginibacter sp. OK283]SEP37790.1 hypothetical protein SAMN05428947_11334 [Mucilaginibacter sp. OK283]